MTRTYQCAQCAHTYTGEGPCPHCGDGPDALGQFLQGAVDAPPAPPGWPVLDPAAMYGLPARVVSTLAQHSEADPAALLLTFLAFFPVAVGPTPQMVVDGSVHTPRLFVVLVGNTSRARKGTSLANVRQVFDVADTIWNRDRVISGAQSGEALVAAVTDDPEGDDPDARAPDRRALLVEEEFSRVLAVSRREGNVLSQTLRSAWDGRRLEVRTKAKTLTATGHHIGVVGHITAEELVRRLDDTEMANGLGNRFLWVAARRAKLLPSGGGPDAEGARQALGKIVAKALREARMATTMARTATAERLWNDLYVNAWADDDALGLSGALTARTEAQVLRLSMIYALTDGTKAIDEEHLRAAVAVWDYCADSVRYVFGDRLGDPAADRLLEALREAGQFGLDGSQQFRVLKGRNADQIGRVRDLLHSRGLARTIVEYDTGGRPRNVTYALDEPPPPPQTSEAQPTAASVLDLIEAEVGGPPHPCERCGRDVHKKSARWCHTCIADTKGRPGPEWAQGASR